MKTRVVSARDEWFCLGIAICFGIAGLAISSFVPFDTKSVFILTPLAAAICGILALTFLGLHMSSRIRRKTVERKKAKETMAAILESVR